MLKIEFIEKARKIHGNKYDYSNVENIKSKNKVCIICPIHGKFWQNVNNHLQGTGCPDCKKEKLHQLHNKGNEKFIKQAKDIHKNKYDYSETRYIDYKTQICIICPEHGEFWQIPNDHLSGCGCPECYGNKRKNREYFIAQANKIHSNKYDYSKTKYVNNHTKICIKCVKHGEFWQTPKNHLKGQGCPVCGRINANNKLKMTLEEFVAKANKIHNNKYDYSDVNIIEEKVDIICNKHGTFQQSKHDHLSGCGCPKCSNIISIGEEEIYNFLKEILPNTLIERRNKKIISPYELDIFIPSKNIAIEYDGLHWHSEKYRSSNYHLIKTNLCKQKNINLFHIFEDEWLYKQEIVKSKLKNIFNIDNLININANECRIKEVTVKEAKTFINENYLQNYKNSSIRYGLYFNNKLISLMTFKRLNNQEFQILSFCDKINTNIIGSINKLLTFFIKNNKSKTIMVYIDKRWNNTELYQSIGFEYINDIKPDYFYVNGNKRENKFKYNKKQLDKQSIYKIYDCGYECYKLET